MTTRVWVLLSFIMMAATLFLVNCGHYTCGATFGSATCTPGGGGITQGPPGPGGGLIAYGYFVDFSQNGQTTEGLAEQVLNTSAGNFLLAGGFTVPALPLYPTGLVIVQKQFMYIPSKDGTLGAYSLDLTTGYPTQIGSTFYPVAGGNSITTNGAGTLLFVGDTTGQQVTVFSVGSNGSLSQVGNPIGTSGITPSAMTTDGLGKYLYVAGTNGSGTNQIAGFSIGSGGALTSLGNPFNYPMAEIAGEKTGKYLLATEGSPLTLVDKNVHVLAINTSTGALTSDTPFPTTYAPTGVQVHQNGNWVYSFSFPTAGAYPNPMEGFTLSSSGTLTEMQGSPFPALTFEAGPIEPSGQFMFGLGVTNVGNNADPTSDAYPINQSTGVVGASSYTQLRFPSIINAAYAVTDGQ
jgi:6-phosphogluconolactonase (cycloisomerase 2 family)